jgi:hypothetical protein
MLSQKAQKMMDSLLLSCKGQYPATIRKKKKSLSQLQCILIW